MSFSNMEIGSQKFMKVESGEPVQFRILSKEPVKRMVHRTLKGVVDCAGTACLLCKDGDFTKTRWRINVWNRQLSKVQLFEFGTTIAKQIKSISQMLEDDGNTIFQVDLKINATGSGLEKSYTVMPKETDDPVPDDLVLFDLNKR